MGEALRKIRSCTVQHETQHWGSGCWYEILTSATHKEEEFRGERGRERGDTWHGDMGARWIRQVFLKMCGASHIAKFGMAPFYFELKENHYQSLSICSPEPSRWEPKNKIRWVQSQGSNVAFHRVDVILDPSSNQESNFGVYEAWHSGEAFPEPIVALTSLGNIVAWSTSLHTASLCSFAPERLVLVLVDDDVTWVLSNCAPNLLYQQVWEKESAYDS